MTSAALSVRYAAIADSHRQKAFVDARLLASAERNPDGFVRVIVQGDEETSTAEVAEEVGKRLEDNKGSPDAVTGRFESITGVADPDLRRGKLGQRHGRGRIVGLGLVIRCVVGRRILGRRLVGGRVVGGLALLEERD